MCVSDLDNSRNSYWSSILGTIGLRQAFILNIIRWILGHIPLFKKMSCLYSLIMKYLLRVT